jgi:hypothetical protein
MSPMSLKSKSGVMETSWCHSNGWANYGELVTEAPYANADRGTRLPASDKSLGAPPLAQSLWGNSFDGTTRRASGRSDPPATKSVVCPARNHRVSSPEARCLSGTEPSHLSHYDPRRAGRGDRFGSRCRRRSVTVEAGIPGGHRFTRTQTLAAPVYPWWKG